MEIIIFLAALLLFITIVLAFTYFAYKIIKYDKQIHVLRKDRDDSKLEESNLVVLSNNNALQQEAIIKSKHDSDVENHMIIGDYNEQRVQDNMFINSENIAIQLDFNNKIKGLNEHIDNVFLKEKKLIKPKCGINKWTLCII